MPVIDRPAWTLHELALRSGSALATFDRKPGQACDAAGIARP